MDVLKNMAK